MPAPEVVVELVDRFARNRESYLAPQYNEAQLRREFVDPLFKALGWDVDNEQGFAEPYKDVIHEDSLRSGGTTKAPDYCFRIGGLRKFFVEAKKPSVDIHRDPAPAFQLRRYAWTAKLSLSVLANFEDFAVYDCLAHRPHQSDKASKGRVLCLKWSEYVERWDEIAGCLSREAVLKGAFDRFAGSRHGKRGTAQVDDEFLKEIESWRLLLARHLALRNPDLSQTDLNFAVQRTIDRIVFLRICEDRGIESTVRLQELLDGSDVYARLLGIFEEADDRYNSGLFHFRREHGRTAPPDELTPSLTIDDAPLKQILRALYYPDSPYEFSVLPADILGSVYEQFLGKVIRLTPGHQARVEDKPEVKKAGGVFYTPTYVVRYVVQRTLEPLLRGRSPSQVERLRIADVACGSGSFLIEVYQHLLDWHLDDYRKSDAKRFRDRLHQTSSGDWRLTTAERKRILLNGVFGIDVDPQAVETTKLSLLLKVLEGENRESLAAQLRLFKQRALPDLDRNIRCGNTLVGADVFAGRNPLLVDEDEVRALNPFDFAAEFPDAMEAGGFDAIVGNPPYVRMETFKGLKDYLRSRYSTHSERSDLYVYFLERALELLRSGGRLGLIVSNKFLRADYGEPVRKLLVDEARLDRIVDLAGLPVFKGATVRTVVLTAEKRNGGLGRTALRYSPPPSPESFAEIVEGEKTLAEVVDPASFAVRARQLKPNAWRLVRPVVARLLDRLADGAKPLKDLVEGRICRGIVSGLNEAFVLSPEQRRRILARNRRAADIIRPFLQGRQIDRYRIEPPSESLICTHHGIDMTPYPGVLDHLRPFRKRLEARATRQEWYELQQPQFAYHDLLAAPKIVFPDMATECRFALDADGRFGANTVYFLPTDDPALLALLNSRLANFWFRQACAALEGSGEAYLRFFGQYMESFPVRLPPAGSAQRTTLTDAAVQIAGLKSRIDEVHVDHERNLLQRRIAACDTEIDRVVFGLYGLGEADVAVVEGHAP